MFMVYAERLFSHLPPNPAPRTTASFILVAQTSNLLRVEFMS